MTVRFKFAEPINRSVVELDPDQGSIQTSVADAMIDYSIGMCGRVPEVTLSIADQTFEADDVDELISFLETVRDRLRKIS